MAVLEVVGAAPRKVLDLQPEAAVTPREHFQHLEPGGDDFHADTIAGDGRYGVFAHAKSGEG